MGGARIGDLKKTCTQSDSPGGSSRSTDMTPRRILKLTHCSPTVKRFTPIAVIVVFVSFDHVRD